jgi:hypothetical protein
MGVSVGEETSVLQPIRDLSRTTDVKNCTSDLAFMMFLITAFVNEVDLLYMSGLTTQALIRHASTSTQAKATHRTQ